MSAKAQRFIVVSLGDTDSSGYDQLALPVLLHLADSHAPDHRVFTHTGVVAHFRTSKKKLEVVRHLVAEAEALRTHDPRFAELKIGIAEGKLVGDFDRRGRLKGDGVGLIGDAIVEAVREEKKPGAWREKLELVAESLHA